MHGFLTKFVRMRNLIIITSVVFIAIVVTSYVYFSNLEKKDQLWQEGGEIADVDTSAADATAQHAVPLWTFDLNAEPANEPAVFLLNDAHRFVLVQDAYHILYAVSANGEKLWNAQLPGAIIGKIHQLPDSSLLFTTAERLYRIDNEGDPLPGFSLQLPQRATESGATPAYENNGDVRINVQAGNRILSFDGRGKRLQIRSNRANLATAGIDEYPPQNSPVDSLPTGCGPLSYYGPLVGNEANYLLCGKDDDRRLYCYRYD